MARWQENAEDGNHESSDLIAMREGSLHMVKPSGVQEKRAGPEPMAPHRHKKREKIQPRVAEQRRRRPGGMGPAGGIGRSGCAPGFKPPSPVGRDARIAPVFLGAGRRAGLPCGAGRSRAPRSARRLRGGLRAPFRAGQPPAPGATAPPPAHHARPALRRPQREKGPGCAAGALITLMVPKGRVELPRGNPH